jgi:gliding motility-associated-like protein
MKIYRDCAGNGADFDNPAHIGVYSYINGIYMFQRELEVLHGAVKGLEAQENPCLILPPNVCVEESSYIINLNNLPLIQGSYIVSWQRCCRNNTITNIVAPNNTGATYMIEVTEEAQLSCNNGPQFINFPPIGICVNDPLTFDHAAVDEEGDQIIYEFCAPLQGGGPLGVDNPLQQNDCNGITPAPEFCPPPFEDVVFNAPNYSPNNPLGTASPLFIDPVTGMITGTPTLTGQFVVGVCVKEYRNGVLLSVLRRDFQFNVLNCTSAVTASIKADAIVNDQEFVLNSCGNNTVTFNNQSQLEAFIDTYRWTFSINGNDVESFERNATFTFPGIGSYRGRMILNEMTDCGDTAYINVNVYPSIDADFVFDYDTCIAGPVNFTDQSTTGAQQLTAWNWNFGDGQKSALRNPDHLYQIPGDHPVQLIVEDNNKCKDTLVQNVNYFPAPPILVVKPEKYKACVPEFIKFTNLSVPIDETYDIRWDFGDGGTSGLISPVHEYVDEGIYTVQLEITSPIGCFISETFPNLITMEASPEAGFSYSPQVVNNINSTVSFSDQSVDASSWYWDFGGEARSFIRNPTYTFQDTGRQKVMQVVFHPNGCADTAFQIIDIEPIVQFFLPNAFTPNYDGKNEVYKPKGLSEGVQFYSLGIWTRWGEKIFETENPDEGWNGRKYNTGQDLPVGVYMCVLQYRDARNRYNEIREFVTLVR